MRILFLIALMSVPLVLSSCRTTAEHRGSRVVVDDGDRYDYDRYDGPPHCPPGHAKKGWC